MSLTDIMSGMGLVTLPLIALVIFVAVFGLIVAHALTRPRRQVEHWSRIPIDDAPMTGDASHE